MVASALAAIRRIVGLLSACRDSARRTRLTAAPTPWRNPHGRLYRSFGLPHVRGSFGALTLLPLLVFLAAGLFSEPVRAATPYPSYSEAMAHCQTVNAQLAQGSACVEVPASCYITLFYPDGKTIYNSYSYPCDSVPSNPCTANAPGMSGGFAGKITSTMTWCKGGVPTGKGTTVSCTMTFTPSGVPTSNQWGSWHTAGTLAPSGDTCDGSGGAGNGWKNPSGQPDPLPVPPSPDSTPPTTPAPKTCGGGSCYDPASDQYCATVGSSQICVPGSQARNSTGGCASSGDSTVCAGSPNAPRPPSGNIPDPAGSLNNTDNYTQANPSTGGNITVPVNTYTNPGGQTSTSGQKTGDIGPPTTGTGKPDCKPGDLCNDRYIGASCDGDPSVAGDPLLGAIAIDMHHVRCQGDKQGLKASDFDGADRSKGDDHSPDEVFSEGSGSGTGDGLAGLDSTGFLGGHGVCPGFAPIEYLGMNILPSDGICRTGEILSAFILAMGYAVAALITARMKSGG
ncbi:hypothetical protein [Dyella humicola]|uniref:hypothetical protein n=1 Tax=Dyella humicola TaxID=2992126 RepID=UPI00225AEF78|nr:hypothetical protein [Dyella humicola]